MPFMRFAKVLTGCLVSLGLYKERFRAAFWIPRFAKKITNPFSSVVVLMPFMRFAKVLTGCLPGK